MHPLVDPQPPFHAAARRPWRPTLIAAAVAALPLLLVGCLSEDEPEPLAVLPAGITELGATAYTATDATTINDVFAAVVSNF